MPKRRVKKASKAMTVRRIKRRRTVRSAAPQADAIGLALAGLAHDIRTPLTGMLAMSDLLLASDLPPRERGWAAAMKDAAGHLARLTTLVVDAARAGVGTVMLQPEPCALRDLVQSVAQSLRARADAKSLAVDISIADALPERVIVDAVRLRSALENLIDNAVKFTERGVVTFTAAAKPAGKRLRLTLSVADTGIGIVAADLRKLFHPFAQANESVARQFGGSGLGLAFAKHIAEAMGGSLTVKSSPGKGSVFRMVVLMDRAPGERRRAGRAAEVPTGLHVLCVEDNPYGRVVLNTVLSELGHRVSFAESGETAVAAVAGGGYDAVLLDVALPGIDGFETARRIRALPGPAKTIPIVGVSGRTGNGDEASALNAGMTCYLRKPASPASLNAALAAVAVPGREGR